MKRNDGFTLLEVLCAIAIFSVAITSLLVARNRSIESAIEAQSIRTARFFLITKLEEIRAGLREIKGSDSGYFEDFPGYTWEASLEEEEVGPPEEPAPGGAPGAPPGGGNPAAALQALAGGGGAAANPLAAALLAAGGMGGPEKIDRITVTVRYQSMQGPQAMTATTYRLKEVKLPPGLAGLFGGPGAPGGPGGQVPGGRNPLLEALGGKR
jgi:prepilin-type N-terminal cleavage/methylation domain-containing protein